MAYQICGPQKSTGPVCPCIIPCLQRPRVEIIKQLEGLFSCEWGFIKWILFTGVKIRNLRFRSFKSNIYCECKICIYV